MARFRVVFLFNLLVLFSFYCLSAQEKPKAHSVVNFINSQHDWVDSVFLTMTPKERIAQLFLVRAHTNLGQKYIDSVAKVVEEEQLGGIVLFQGGPIRHAQLINRYQSLSKIPLLVALDGEWGLGMRMPDSTLSYPFQMTLGAIQNDELLYKMGISIAQDFKRLGLNFNFAPVVDVNNNPNNPVINFRSFGENRQNVMKKGLSYMRGMLDEGILVSLKHFPGHGDTEVDSHHDLPVLSFGKDRLDSVELFPFQQLIHSGVPSVMIAHMQIPALDTTANLPSSLSKPIVTELLKEKLGFQGLVVTDAMDMKGVVKYFKEGEADLRAIEAGVDLLELSENSARAINLVLAAIDSGRILQKDIDQRVKKVLASKYWLHLENRAPVEIDHLYADINRGSSRKLIDNLAESAVTLLNGSKIRDLDDTKKTAIIGVGTKEITKFQDEASTFFDDYLFFVLPKDPSAEELANIRNELQNFDQIIVALHDVRPRPRNVLEFQPELINLIGELASMNSVFCVFANPYAIAHIPGIEKAQSILMCYQNDEFMQKAAAKVIGRKIIPSGKLPVTINTSFKSGDGL